MKTRIFIYELYSASESDSGLTVNFRDRQWTDETNAILERPHVFSATGAFLFFFTEDAQDRLNPPGFSRNTRQPSVGVHAAWHPLSDTVEW